MRYNWSTLEKISVFQSIPITSILIIVVILPGVSAVACKGDQYFDPNTGNCDPCAPLCAVTNCSRICPHYKVPRVSSIVQPAGSNNSSSFSKDYFVIIIAVIAFVVIAFALFGYISYRRYHQNNREIPVTTVAIQIDGPDTESDESVPMNTNTEHV